MPTKKTHQIHTQLLSPKLSQPHCTYPNPQLRFLLDACKAARWSTWRGYQVLASARSAVVFASVTTIPIVWLVGSRRCRVSLVNRVLPTIFVWRMSSWLECGHPFHSLDHKTSSSREPLGCGVGVDLPSRADPWRLARWRTSPLAAPSYSEF
jgi:hypothetical protein